MSKDYGSKPGSGGISSASNANIQRRDRLRSLALDNIDLSKDPYFMKNHLGSYECKLCLTIHIGEGSYISHTQGKKHQENLSRRAAREKELSNLQNAKIEAYEFIIYFLEIIDIINSIIFIIFVAFLNFLFYLIYFF